VKLRADLEQKGITLTPQLTYRSVVPLDAETLALLKENKADLLRDLTAPDSIPRLPWQLERLISAAGSNQLPKDRVTLSNGLIHDMNPYTLAVAAAYLVGDRQAALSRLWELRRVWQPGEVVN